MFGTIRPCFSVLQKQQREIYKHYYCGLCMAMGRWFGLGSRALVNYEVCIAYIILDAAEADDDRKRARCPFTLRSVQYRDNMLLLEKLSTINYLLFYHKVLDDIQDDDSKRAKIMLREMKPNYFILSQKHPAVVESVENAMESIRLMEWERAYVSLEESAMYFGSPFGSLLAASVHNAADVEVIRLLMGWVGRWIYVVDACLDIKKDYARGKYNPIYAGTGLNPDKAVSMRRDEIASFLMKSRQMIFQLLELYNCGKNKELIYSIFEHALPREVAELLT
jgi:hypothetical protein